jgi:hypothetical protein
MGFAKLDVWQACAECGEQLEGLPAGIDGPTLLWAIAGNESSFGVNTVPRHEPAYDVGGSFYAYSLVQRALIAEYGSAAACSYGPWQMMFCVAPTGTQPEAFEDLDQCAAMVVEFLNYDLANQKPQTLAEIGSIWNAGHIQRPMSPAVQAYADELQNNYAVPPPTQ